MRKLIRVLVSLLIPAFVLAGLVASPAMAQVKAKATVHLDNDKVLVREVTLPPGFVGPSVARPQRVIHVLKGGTTAFIHPDGKREEMVWKTGDTHVREPSAVSSVANEGKSDIVFFEVIMKDPKK